MSKYLVNNTSKNIFNGKVPRYESARCYSTNEQIVGIWHDGRPLYRRTYIIEGDIQYSYDIDMTENVDICLLDPTHSYYVENTGMQWGIGIVDSETAAVQTRTYYNIPIHHFVYVKSQARAITKSVLTLCYTKISDNQKISEV